MVSHSSLKESKFLQVSMTLLNILPDLNNAVVWMVSTCPLISKSSCPFTNHLGIVPSAPITIGSTITFMFHSFFCSPARSLFASLFTFFKFYLVVHCDSKVHNSAGFFLLIMSGHLSEIRWFICISKSLCVTFLKTDFSLCINHLFV